VPASAHKNAGLGHEAASAKRIRRPGQMHGTPLIGHRQEPLVEEYKTFRRLMPVSGSSMP